MVIPDANLLIYAYNPDAPQNREASRWLQEELEEKGPVGFTWLTLWAFARIVTNARIWPRAVAPELAFDRIEEWLALPNTALVGPGSRHGNVLRRLVIDAGAVGSKLSDAVLAAIAIEHAATLASTDRDFRRFSGLRWVNPLE